MCSKKHRSLIDGIPWQYSGAASRLWGLMDAGNVARHEDLETFYFAMVGMTGHTRENFKDVRNAATCAEPMAIAMAIMEGKFDGRIQNTVHHDSMEPREPCRFCSQYIDSLINDRVCRSSVDWGRVEAFAAEGREADAHARAERDREADERRLRNMKNTPADSQGWSVVKRKGKRR